MTVDPMRTLILALKDQMDAGMADLNARVRRNGPRFERDLAAWNGDVRRDPWAYAVLVYRVEMYHELVPEAERRRLNRRWRWKRRLRRRSR